MPAAYQWKNVQIHGGGFVSGIIYSPAEQNLLYARTDVGGAYRWNVSTRTWIPITDYLSRDESNFMGVLSVAPDPSDPNRVYLATGTYTQSWAGRGAILASNDKGNTWTRYNLRNKLGGNENGRGTGEALQVDPNLGTTLLLGTSNGGLWKSTNRAANWSKVTTFPVDTTQVGSNGISFVLFDKASGTTGTATGTVYVGVLRTGAANLFKTTDGGATWAAVAGAPTTLMAHHAALAADGTLYLAYSNGPGPNGVTAGDVMKYVPSTGVWTSIKPNVPVGGGYGGISLDPQRPGTIVVSTIDRWGPGDEVFRTTDGGANWRPLINWRATNKSNLDHSLSPSNATSNPHWIADVDLDPFNSNNAWFTTGYGLFSSGNIAAADQGTPTPAQWKFENKGLEELVPRGLICPPTGAPLVSIVADIDGYRHDNLDVVPATRLTPEYGTNASIDFAELLPTFMVRTHNNAAGKYGAYSTNGGTTWTPFGNAPTVTGGGGNIAVAADGSRMLWQPDPASNQTVGVYWSTDRGTTWTASTGITPTRFGGSLRPVADRVNPLKFYVYDAIAGRVLTSTDGGVTFTAGATTFISTPDYLLGDATLRAVFGREGELWLTFPGTYGTDPRAALYRSTNSGAAFQEVTNVAQASAVGFGKSSISTGYPAIYIVGTVGSTYGFYRSDDTGATWVRINDTQHQFGYVGIIVGDRNVYGRVYLTTGGRGIVYGELTQPLSTTQTTKADGRSLSVYPNPASNGTFQVALAGFAPGEALQLKITTTTGRVVYQQGITNQGSSTLATNVQVTQKLRAGLYMVQITGKKGSLTSKLVVQ
jgi:hypothetical protein